MGVRSGKGKMGVCEGRGGSSVTQWVCVDGCLGEWFGGDGGRWGELTGVKAGAWAEPAGGRTPTPRTPEPAWSEPTEDKLKKPFDFGSAMEEKN